MAPQFHDKIHSLIHIKLKPDQIYIQFLLYFWIEYKIGLILFCKSSNCGALCICINKHLSSKGCAMYGYCQG